jgi:hypothetical protein
MDRTHLRRLLLPDADEALQALSTRQFVNPHKPVAAAVLEVAEGLGICSSAAARSVTWLELDGSSAFGRLRRSELAQLARSMVRFARHQASLEAAAEASSAAETTHG